MPGRFELRKYSRFCEKIHLKPDHTADAWQIFRDNHDEICCGFRYSYFDEIKKTLPISLKDFTSVKEFTFSGGDYFEGFDEYRLIKLSDNRWWFAFLPSHIAEEKAKPFICSVSDKEADSFLQEIYNKTDVVFWDEIYDDPDIYDGHEWSIRAVFEDDTLMSRYGHEKYPKRFTYTMNFIIRLFKAFKKRHINILTGKEIRGYFI